MCNCHSYNKDTGIETEIILTPPEWMGLAYMGGEPKTQVAIDKCIAHVISHLWGRGVATLNSCCGHGKANPSIIFGDNKTEADAVAIREIIAAVDVRNFEILSWRLVSI
jgi:hypothetical protein